MNTEVILIFLMAGSIIFFSHIIKGATGFANALIAIPLLSLLMDIRFVVPMFLLFDFPSSGMIAWKERKFIQWKEVGTVFIGVFIGTLIGAYLLISLATDILKPVFGLVVIGFGLHIATRKNPIEGGRWGRGRGKMLGVISGFLAGITGGMFGMDGPIVVLYLSHQLQKAMFRATLVSIFLLGSFWRGSLYIYGGILELEQAILALGLVPFLICGVIVGSRFHNHLSQRQFSILIGSILVIAGILLIST